jgi:hypothetical protein
MTELHQRAHELEHVHDKESVDYLDDLLGHPVIDPHGKLIPENHVHCRPGNVCMLSLLREGRVAVVESIAGDAENVGLEPGDRISVGPRTEKGALWTVIREDGSVLSLGHQAADAIRARILDDGSMSRGG